MVTVSSALNWWMLFCFVALRACKCVSERTVSEQSKANGYCYLFEHTASQTKLRCLLLRMGSERRGRNWTFLSGKLRMSSIAITFRHVWDVHKWMLSKANKFWSKVKNPYSEVSPPGNRHIIHLCSQSFITFSSVPFLNTSFHSNKSSFFTL